MKEQEQLIVIYERLTQLKREGIKMKDIAAELDMSPSVLSALYATVLPAFCTLIEENSFEDALTGALANINNLSRKRLLESVEGLYQYVMNMESGRSANARAAGIHPFIHSLKEATALSADKVENLEGMYMSYSCSSSVRALKAEPFYFIHSKENNCFAVGRKSVHNSIREGVGVIQEQQILYLMFNAFREPNMSLVTVYLQLPFLENIRFLKGLYLVLDYNKNPIARRIVLVKLGNHYSPEEFEKIEAKLIMEEDFTEDETLIYKYTCGKADSIKMCTLPSPKLDLRDLQIEKKLLDKEEEFEVE